MASGGLRAILDTEAGAFQRIDRRWRPNDLFFELQTKELLADMTRRCVELSASEDELKRLDRAEACSKLLRTMKFIVRRASFVRRSDHLAFAQAVAEFYGAYGQLLRFLQFEGVHGNLEPQPLGV